MRHTAKFSFRRYVALCICLFILSPGAMSAAHSQQNLSLVAANEGIALDCGAFGRFTLTYPELDRGRGEPLKPVGRTVSQGHATLKYADNAQVDVAIEPGGGISYAFSNPPAGLKSYRMSMLIDFSFARAESGGPAKRRQ